MGWLAVLRAAVLMLAVVIPPVVLTEPWPILVNPSKKFTVPVGVPGPFGLTVAVNVTVWPDSEALADETTDVVVVAVVLMLAVAWKTRMPSTWLRFPSVVT